MFDVVIIGAGVIGLAIAKAIGNNSNKSVLVIEKEDTFGLLSLYLILQALNKNLNLLVCPCHQEFQS